VVAVAVVTGLMVAVVPRVVEQFDAASRQLPWLTRVVIALRVFLPPGAGPWRWGWRWARWALHAGWPGRRFARGWMRPCSACPCWGRCGAMPRPLRWRARWRR
jgi:hypothetical protein